MKRDFLGTSTDSLSRVLMLFSPNPTKNPLIRGNPIVGRDECVNPFLYQLSTMKRASKFAQLRKCLPTSRFPHCNYEGRTKPSAPICFICQYTTQTHSGNRKLTSFGSLASLFSEKMSYYRTEKTRSKDLEEKVAGLRDEILAHRGDVGKIEKVLEENGVALFRRYSDGSAIVELLRQLQVSPSVAMEVFGWRRKQPDYTSPMTIEEYSKGICIAGKLNDIDLAAELFKEALNKQLKGTSLFNALMSVYMRSGSNMKCQLVFQDLKRDPTCAPSITSYNILISSFGRLMRIDHMEASFKELQDLNLTPNIRTYLAMISGYVTAWKWEEMEKTYMSMKDGPVEPNLDVLLLMLRGYALAVKIEKMEEIYKMVRDHVDAKETRLIRVMIRAYCKSNHAARVERVEELLGKIPKYDYQPWLNVQLICLYAKENVLEQMENLINEAFERKTYVTASSVMRCIISNYYRHNDVAKLSDFVKRVEVAGWKLCRSLYHCKMVMYSSQMRLSEMEKVLDEMGRINMHISQKTLWILYNAYKQCGEKSKFEQVIGRMCINGYAIPEGAFDPMIYLE